MPGGLELWQGGRHVLPEASLCLSGVPDSIETNAGLVIFIDQITDGTAVLRLLQDLHQQGVSGNRIRLITALCASPGLKTLGEAVPDLTIYTTCIDEELDESGLAVPGIGDPLQRLNLRLKGPCLDLKNSFSNQLFRPWCRTTTAAQAHFQLW
jgi:uracil phosphoribosyltransferase